MSLSFQKKLKKMILTGILLMLAISFIFPFIWMISTSFKYEIDVMEIPFRLIPKKLNLMNYVKVWTKSSFLLFYINSIKVTLITVIGDLCLTSMAAYAFARLKFRGKNIIFAAYMATMMVPTQVMLLPKYLIFRKFNMVNTHWALILPGVFSIFSIFLLRQFFMTIPYEMTEAAKIDGAGPFTVFLRVILPLAKPGLVTLILISSIWSWNDYINPLIFISDTDRFTLTVGLQLFQKSNSTNYAVIMAGAVCAVLPIIILFLLLQKQFIESFSSSGIKG